MKRKIITLFFVIVVSCQTQNKNQDDINEIHQWIANYEEAIKASDVKTLLAGVSDAIVYYPPNQPAFSGKENLKKWFLDYFNYYDPSELLIVRDIKVEEDIAYLSCYYVVHVKVKNSGEEYRDLGKLVNIFKREHLGNWKCIYSIWNSNNHTIDFHSKIPVDFSGDWELDLAHSTRIPNLISSRIIITQQGDNIIIERSYQVQGKDPLKSVLNCTIGREIKSKSKSESQITTSFWSTDKQSFTITEKLISVGEEYKRTTNYSLTRRGECLKVILFDQIPHGLLDSTGHEQIVMIFNKIPNTK
jgi:ketosteroid isomerase-like protein